MSDPQDNGEVEWTPRSREHYLSKVKTYSLSVSPGGAMVNLNELLWTVFQTCSPDGKMEAAVFGEDPDGNILIRVCKSGEPLSAEIKVAKSNRWARFEGKYGFTPAEIPLLRETTAHFDVRRVTIKGGGFALQVLVKTARPAGGTKHTKKDQQPPQDGQNAAPGKQ